MIPTSISILIFVFIIAYFIGLTASVSLLFLAIKDKNIPVSIISVSAVAILSAFGLALI